MKKTLISAITTALVVGAASTTFAAANPFSDVPSDHWSYDAVSKLAQDGVIDGYGDGTFRGDQKITRYEMAQMVAKAMTKTDVSAADKAMIDKLAAEYSDELSNLGVRVANLEKKSDNVKFVGLVRLNAARESSSYVAAGSTTRYGKTVNGDALLRLDLTAAVNDNWNVHARLDADSNLNNNGDTNSVVSGNNDSPDNHVQAAQIYAEGPLFGADAQFGKFAGFDSDSLTNGGLILDENVTGAQFRFGKALQTKLTYGRLSNDDVNVYGGIIGDVQKLDFAEAQFNYMAGDKLDLAAGYTHINGDGLKSVFDDGTDSIGIWNAGFDYKLTKDLVFGGEYAGSNGDSKNFTALDATSKNGVASSDEEKAYSVQLTYKGAKQDVAGSYGVWAAYRQLGSLATIAPTYDGARSGTKGYEIGVNYMVDKNILTKLVYFDGKNITDNGLGDGNKVKRVFGRVEFAF